MKFDSKKRDSLYNYYLWFIPLVKVLKEKLLKENKGKLIDWLQSILIECCFAKLCCVNNRISPNVDTDDTSKITIIEPVPHHCICNAHSIP